jgi:succinate-acetate transporter protein
MIIKFCSCQYQACHKFQELTDRLDGQQPLMPAAIPPVPNDIQGKREALPILGLFCYGIAAASYAVDKLPVITLDLHLLAIILMLGSVGQISAGLSALKNNPLRAIAFTGFGLFWLSILALDILPRAGYGSSPGPIPMMGYLAMWGMFSLIICQGLEQMTRTSRLVFAMLTAFLLLLAVAHATRNTAFLHGSALVGLASSLPGLYLGLRHVGSEAMHLVHPEVADQRRSVLDRNHGSR